jgi:hypothetical protein
MSLSGTLDNGVFRTLLLLESCGVDEADLSALESLEELTCGVPFKPDGWRIRRLGVAGLKHLRVLRCQGHALKELDLRGCLALVEVSAESNQLHEVHLPEDAPLERLRLSHNRLETLPIGNADKLKELDCAFNPIRALDLALCRGLVSLACHGLGLSTLQLPSAPDLQRLFCSKNPLKTLDVSGYPALSALMCGEMGLSTLDVSRNTELTHLACAGNDLTSLSLVHNTHLTRLDVRGNPLTSLDLRCLSRLRVLELDDRSEPELDLRCTELQRHLIPALRRRFGLGSGSSKIAKMNAFELHGRAQDHNWDDDIKPLLEIIRRDVCDLGTALMVYWNGGPGEYLPYATPSDAPRSEHKTLELLLEIEHRVADGFYTTRRIPYDPRNVDGFDLTIDTTPDPARHARKIPEAMLQAIEPESVPEQARSHHAPRR